MLSFSDNFTQFKKNNPQLVDIENKVQLFVAASEGLDPDQQIEKLKEMGIHQIGFPAEYGGTQTNTAGLVAICSAMTSSLIPRGVVTTWLMNIMVSRCYLLNHGSKDLCKQWLPQVVDSKKVISIAVSEPEGGANPKTIKTEAKVEGDRVTISGTKTFITNGMIADAYVVMSITGVDGSGKKAFSTFLVPRDTAGLSVVPMKEFDHMKPATHATITLDNCEVPVSNRVGEAGIAYDKYARPFPIFESVVQMGTQLGNLRILITECVQAMSDRTLYIDQIGALASALSTLELTAAQSGDIVDSAAMSSELNRYLLAFNQQIENLVDPDRGLFPQLVAALQSNGDSFELESNPAYQSLVGLAKFGRRVNLARSKRAATELLAEIP